MEYKLKQKLLTENVEPFADFIHENRVMDKTFIAANAIFVRKAIEFGWFEKDTPDVGKLEPEETLRLGTEVMKAYSRVMGFDRPNSPAEPPTSPTA